MKIWNFGIIGAGMIADFHAKAIQSLGNAKLAGISGTNKERVKTLAEKYSCKSYNDTVEMLDSYDIDIVIIATPSGAHLEPAIQAAQHGKHVICEKPMEITLERIDKMIQAHMECGTKLGAIFNYRFNNVVQILKNVIDAGRFGTITLAAVYVPWWRSDEYYKSSWRGTWNLDGGGALMNQSIHMVDMLQYLMGPISALCAYTSTLGHPQIEVEDTAVAIVKFTNNTLGMIHGSTASFPGQYRRLEIAGTKGTVIMEDNSFKIWQFAESVESDNEILKKYGNIEGGGGAADPSAIPFQPHARNIAAFIDSIEKDEPFEIDGLEARKSVEIILGIYKSAKEHTEVYF